MSLKFEVYGLKLPEVRPGTDLAKTIVEHAVECGVGIRDYDIIIVTSKVILKAKGLTFKLDSVKPSLASKVISWITGKDPVEVELVLKTARDFVAVVDVEKFLGDRVSKISEDLEATRRLIRRVPFLILVTTKQGLLSLDGGVDYSNLPPGHAIANIVDFDVEAENLRREVERLTGKRVAVVITDTEFNISGKVGSVDVAVGSSGIKPVTPLFGSKDIYGKPKFGGVDIIVDELASTAALLMGQTSEGIPVVIVRGLKYTVSDEGVKEYTLKLKGIPLSLLFKTLLVKLAFKILHRQNR